MTVPNDSKFQTVISVVVISLLVGGLVFPAAVSGVVAQQSQPEADNTVTRIEVSENGSARWTIQIRTRLDTEQRVDEYTAFQDRFKNDTARYLGPFRNRMQGVVANAENATGRRMQATNFTASTSIQEIPRRWGVVTYEFTWTNVAAQENGQVIVGDVFQGGFFIAANDTLQIVAPDEYEIARVDPDPDSRENGVVTWNGRQDFADGNPSVAYAPATDQPGKGNSLLETIGGPVVVSIVVAILLGLGGAIAYRRRNSDTGGVAGTTEGSGEQPGTASTTGQSTDSEGQTTQETVLTDEERVLELLEANGGRMRQAAIAEELDWSASKTSRVVGGMADEEEVEKLQLGRENLVSLPDERT